MPTKKLRQWKCVPWMMSLDPQMRLSNGTKYGVNSRLRQINTIRKINRALPDSPRPAEKFQEEQEMAKRRSER